MNDDSVDPNELSSKKTRRRIIGGIAAVPLIPVVTSAARAVTSEIGPPSSGFVHAGRSDKLGEAEDEDIVMRFDFPRCIHRRYCVTRQPHVYRTDTDQWMNPQYESAERIAANMETCPSGALQYFRKDGGPQETPSGTNTVHVWENGPFALRGDLKLDGQNIGYRATLCRCGQSRNAPFCDNSHKGRFEGTGELAVTDRFEELDASGGVLRITTTEDQRITVEGNLQICAGSGYKIAETKNVVLCGCGKSSNMPFCDDSHKQG